MAIAALIIVGLARAAFRRSPESHLPDQPTAKDPITHAEAATGMFQYMIDLDRSVHAMRAEIEDLRKVLRTPDGGSQLERILSRLSAVENLLRKRAKRNKMS